MSFITDYLTGRAASLQVASGRLLVDTSSGPTSPDTSSSRTPISLPQGSTTTGSVSSATNLFSADLSSYLGVTVQITGTWVGTVTFECSENSTVWQSVQAANAATGAIASTATANGVYLIPRVARYIRARVSTYTSGTLAFGWTPYSEQAVQYNLATILSLPNVTIGTITGGANLIGDVGLQVRSTGGTISTARLLSSAATTNATSVKTSAGKLVRIRGYNAAASIRYLKLYNKASAPTVGTDTPVLTLAIPASGSFEFDLGALGFPFATGIAYAITGAAADADTTAIAAGDITCLNVLYV